MSEDAGRSPAARKKRGPRKVSEKRLNNVALHYLARYSASADSLRRVLMRRVRRSVQTHGTDLDEGTEWVEALLVRFQELGYLDDRAYAENRARSLMARGTSTRGIQMRLREKGVGGGDIDAALEALSESWAEPDLAAAAKLARRRRLGPYRDPELRGERRDKDLAALARTGFSYDIARRVIDAEDADTLETMAEAEEAQAGPRYEADEN